MLSLATLLRKNLAVVALGVAAVAGIGLGAGAIIGVSQSSPSGSSSNGGAAGGSGAGGSSRISDSRLAEETPGAGSGSGSGSASESGRAPIRNDQATQEEFEKQFEGRDSAKAKSIDELTPAERKELGLD